MLNIIWVVRPISRDKLGQNVPNETYGLRSSKNTLIR